MSIVCLMTTKGVSFSVEMIAIPRIGETVMIDETSFKVIDVIYRIAFGTET